MNTNLEKRNSPEGKKKLAPDFNPGGYVKNMASRRAATNDE
jgi:hypothetical protein